MDNASVALLMLDIASAKFTLKELQQAYTAANEEHQRTKSQLHDLEQELDVNPLYMVHGAKGSTANSGRATAQQLQALHTENLQLKSLLKQEIESRQQLEAKHSALLEMLRNCGLLLTPSAGQSYASSEGDSSHGYEQLLQHGGIRQHTAPDTATKQNVPLQEHVAGTDFKLPAVRPLHAFQPASSSAAQQAAHSNSTSTIAAAAAVAAAGEASFPASQRAPTGRLSSRSSLQHGLKVQQPMEAAPATQRTKDRSDAYLSSAYFPHLGKQPVHTSSARAVPVATGRQQGAYDLQCASKLAPTAGTWHGVDSSQQQGGHCDMQQQQQQTPMVRDWEHLAPTESPATCAAVQGSSYSSSASLSSISSHSHDSHASELLDSEDLEELACLCDGLIGQQAGSRQQDVLVAAAAAVAAAVTAAGCPGSATGSGASMQRSKSAPHTSSKIATAQQPAEQQQQARHDCMTSEAQQQPMEPCIPQTLLPGMEVLTTQLQQLQQQVAMDPGLMQHHNSTSRSSPRGKPPTACGPAPAGEAAGNAATGSTGVAAPPSTSQQQPLGRAAPCGLNDPPQHSKQASSSSSVASGSSSAYHSSSNISRLASSLGSTMQQQGSAESAGVMADLQQQLAQRMLEVKQRLSNICNGMLEEALASDSSNATTQERATTATAASQGPTLAPAVHAVRGPTATTATPYDGSKIGSLCDMWQQQQQQQNPSKPASATRAAASAAFGAAGTGPPSTSSWGTSSISSDINSAHLPLKQDWQQQQHGNSYGTKDAVHPPQKSMAAYEVHADAHTRSVAAEGGVGVSQQEVCRRARVGQRPVCNFQAAQDTSCAISAGIDKELGTEAPAAAADDEQHAPHVAAGQCGSYVQAEGDYHDAADGICGDSSWSSCEAEDERQQQQARWSQRPQQTQQLQEGHSDQHNKRQRYQQAHAIGTPQGTPDKLRCQAGSSGTSSSDGGSPSSNPSAHQYASGHRMWQQEQQRHQQHKRTCVSDSLEGVLFGLGGRVAAEVSQTFSPLKGPPPSGQAFWSPGSPLTPVKPRNA